MLNGWRIGYFGWMDEWMKGWNVDDDDDDDDEGDDDDGGDDYEDGDDVYDDDDYWVIGNLVTCWCLKLCQLKMKISKLKY